MCCIIWMNNTFIVKYIKTILITGKLFLEYGTKCLGLLTTLVSGKNKHFCCKLLTLCTEFSDDLSYR